MKDKDFNLFLDWHNFKKRRAHREKQIAECRANFKDFDDYMKQKEAEIQKEKELLEKGAVITVMSIYPPHGTWKVNYANIKKVYGK